MGVLGGRDEWLIYEWVVGKDGWMVE